MRNKKNIIFLILAAAFVLLIVIFTTVRYVYLDNGMPWKINEKITAFEFGTEHIESIELDLNIFRKYSGGKAPWRGTITFEGVEYEVQNIGHEKKRGFDIIGYVILSEGVFKESLSVYIWNDDGQLLYMIKLFRNDDYKVYFGPADNYEEAEDIFNRITTP